MIDWYTYWLIEQHRQHEMAARLEQRRQWIESVGAMRRPRRYHQWLAMLGGLLVDWGCRLQSHYEALAVPELVSNPQAHIATLAQACHSERVNGSTL